MPQRSSPSYSQYNSNRRTTYSATPDGQLRAIDTMTGRESSPTGGVPCVTVAAPPAGAKSVNHFSIERVAGYQCLGTRVYDVDPTDIDHAYLHTPVVDVLRGVIHPDAMLRSSASIVEPVKQMFIEIAADPEASVKVTQFFFRSSSSIRPTINQSPPTPIALRR